MAYADRNARPSTRGQYHRPHLEPGEDAHLCEFSNCAEDGIYKAPHSPKALREWRWFCLDHVRDYNKAWNYFSGWSEDDIDNWRREDLTGHRPTWRMGSAPGEGPANEDLEKNFHRFAREWFGEASSQSEGDSWSAREAVRPTGEHSKALETLDLDPPYTLESLKRQYKVLVKRHHPDANGGSKESEELLKTINQAYTYLLKQLS